LLVLAFGVLAHQTNWSLSWLSDLDHCVLLWLHFLLAVLAQIEVWSEGALVSDSDDWLHSAVVTSDMLVNYLSLGFLSFFESLDQELLVLGCAVLSDLFSQNFL